MDGDDDRKRPIAFIGEVNIQLLGRRLIGIGHIQPLSFDVAGIHWRRRRKLLVFFDFRFKFVILCRHSRNGFFGFSVLLVDIKADRQPAGPRP